LPQAQLFGVLAVTALLVDTIGLLPARSAVTPAPTGKANAA
jgi:hypothetical protein